MPLLYQLDKWRCEVALNGFFRHLLLFVASFYGFWFDCPKDLTPLYTYIIVLTIVFLINAIVMELTSRRERNVLEISRVHYGFGYFGVSLCAIVPYLFFARNGVASEVGSIYHSIRLIHKSFAISLDPFGKEPEKCQKT